VARLNQVNLPYAITCYLDLSLQGQIFLEAKELTCPKPTAPKKEIYHTNQEKENEYRPKRRINEKVMAVSNMSQWLNEFLQVRFPLI
jgi:hypothetical protein